MDYKDINDNELLYMISEENEIARSEIVKKYTGIVHKIAGKYAKLAESFGIDKVDLVQEGLIGLSKAIDTYNPEKNVLFYTYVTLCIETSIKSSIKIASKQGNKTLNNSISIDQLSEENFNINELLKDEESDPSLKILESENTTELIENSKKILTDFEYEVFKLKIEGYSNQEVSNITKKDKKSIENTLFRIKNKLKK